MKRIFTKFSVLTFLCLLFTGIAFAQNITVKGTVTDGQDKTSIPSVSVMVKGTTTGTQTDAAGRYTISAPAGGTLVFTYIGYVTKEVPIANQSTVNVTLSSSSQQLDQVVVVGYGTQRKIDVTGAVANLKGDEISKQASTNPVAALQGKIAGVSITNTGTPGTTPQIRIRGLGTIFGNQAPLYVVDGVWYNDITFLNPGDIENMSVLKDASAQSIYGIRAANGVVLITTKKGKSNTPTTINYDGYVGFQKVTNQVKMANATEYATFTNELAKLNGGNPVFANTDLGAGTDWYKQLLRNAFVTNHNVSVAGGSEKSNYNISLGYLNQDGIIKSNNYKRYTARVSNDVQIFKNLKVGYNITGLSSKSNDIPLTIYHQLYAAAPSVPVFNPDGTYGDPKTQNLGDGANFNPQASIDFNNQITKQYSVTGNIFAELNFAKHFTFKTSFGGEFGQLESRKYAPVYYATYAQKSDISVLDIKRVETRNWIIENTLTYQNTFNENHNLTVLVGQSAQSNKGYILNGTAQNVPYNTESDLYLALGDAATRSVIDAGTLIKFASYFTRANYSFKNKYLLNASMRADGASQFFGSDQTWGYFPSVGAGWVISNEDFMKDQTVFSSLKLRGSWGKIGNASVPINPSQQLIDQNPTLIAIFNNAPFTGKNITSLPPQPIVWEKGIGTDVGVEAAFLTNRLKIEADYYNRKTSRAIFNIPVLGSLGTSNNQLLGNQADIQNKGVEFSAAWSDVTGGGLSYSIGGNISYNANKVLAVLSGSTPIYGGSTGITNGSFATRTIAGSPIGMFYGYKTAGIFQNASEIANSPVQSDAAPGGFKYQDLNGDGRITSADRTEIGNPNPKYTYGVNTSFAYKNFDLALDFQGVASVDVYNANLAYRFGNENITKDFYDHRWHGEGTSNTYPSANLGAAANSAPNSFYVSSGAYFRVRNAQLGYTLPSSILNKWKIKKIRIYANAQNAINIFGYKGFSPEVGPVPVDNAAKITTTPLPNTTLNSGLDANVYPLFATYNFGVNLTF